MRNQLLEVTAIIQGNVQGVGFRAATKRLADRLQVTGFVRNLPNGDVELCAQGEKAQLELLLSELKREFSSHIAKITSTIHSASSTYPDFKIIH